MPTYNSAWLKKIQGRLQKRRKVVTPPEIPNLIEIQLRSYQWFLNEGLQELFDTFSPIEDYTKTLALEFIDYTFGEPNASPEECREKDLTYEMPFKARARLVDKETGEVKEWTDVYLGEIPCMTGNGTFIINGAERVVVCQLGRSPGAYFHSRLHELTGKELFSAQVIARDGAWVEFETDADDVVRVRVGQSRWMPFTLLMRAFSALRESRGVPPKVEEVSPRKEEIIGLKLASVVIDPQTGKRLADEGEVITPELQKSFLEAKGLESIAIMREHLRCGTTSQIIQLFGQQKLLRGFKKGELIGKWITDHILHPDGKRILVRGPKRLNEDDAERIIQSGIRQLYVWELHPYVDATLQQDPAPDEKTALLQIHRILRPSDPPTIDSARSLLQNYFFDRKRYDLGRVGRYKLNRKLRLQEEVGYEVPLSVQTFTLEDLVAVVRYLIKLRTRSELEAQGQAELVRRNGLLNVHTDDIDHLQNKRLRAVGELLQGQLRLAFLRLERAARERMTTAPDKDSLTPHTLISIKPLTAAIRSFFGSGQLSQFMQQTNPLDELEHKRRCTALGPGGVSRESAKGMLQLRDVHPSHYGRLCPIQTPEGPNIGLISSLTVYAKVDEFGFLLTPYQVVRDGRVTKEVRFLSPDEDANFYIAPADTEVDEAGRIIPSRVICRGRHPEPPFEVGYVSVPRERVQLMDVSPVQCFSMATCLIPFLENDDCNRALMGSNMQRQAVPLLRAEAPLVRTGLEEKAAKDSGAVVVCDVDGIVEEVDAQHLTVKMRGGAEKRFALRPFARSNQGTCFHQKPVVRRGQRVRIGELIADGPATAEGQLALGKNLLCAFMLWEGYNYEDAIVISERLAREDVLTSLHIEKYEVAARETKLGPEEITRDVPNVSEEKLHNLDEFGIIRVGAEVKSDDILVGKASPKTQGEQSPEEKLMVAIFGKKAEDMRDSSLRMPHGEWGTVIGVSVFSRFKYQCQKCGEELRWWKRLERLECKRCGGKLSPLPADELKPQVNMMVRVYVAQRRKIQEGDKLSGRHGNKGVVSKILPEADMPFLPDGTSVDIILNPLGVPSRMNVGQILETHVGWLARQLGVQIECPVFEGMKESDVLEGMAEAVGQLRKEKLNEVATKELGLKIRRPKDNESFEEYLEEAIREPLQEMAADERGQERLEELAALLGVDVEEWRSRAWERRPSLLLEAIRDSVHRRVGFDEKTGKCTLIDGRTGEPFQQKVMVGVMYIMKLAHLVEDKMHARATGPYSLVTQQPLGGKAQFGGQRFGEMEVWALEAYGSAYTLQEMLTTKSDDVHGRVKTFEALVKGQQVMEPGVPESLKILLKELQSLCLQVTLETRDGQVVELTEDEDESQELQPFRE